MGRRANGHVHPPRDVVRLEALLITSGAVALAEIGDKTQIATVALAARFGDAVLVTLGATLGMLLANAPVVLAGDAIANRVPLSVMRAVTAGVFAVLGGLTLLGVGGAVVGRP